jgi:hypothetical protein
MVNSEIFLNVGGQLEAVNLRSFFQSSKEECFDLMSVTLSKVDALSPTRVRRRSVIIVKPDFPITYVAKIHNIVFHRVVSPDGNSVGLLVLSILVFLSVKCFTALGCK